MIINNHPLAIFKKHGNVKVSGFTSYGSLERESGNVSARKS